MALFTEDKLKERIKTYQKRHGLGTIYDSKDTAKKILSKSINEQRLFSAGINEYDIFLSHSLIDAEIIAGLKLKIEDMGFSVYVDWLEDPLLNRSNVTKETALLLQQRMKDCKSLIYAFSENATNSKWMPWELGYFDGFRGTVAVLPITRTHQNSFQGSEYLGIYYYIQSGRIKGENDVTLWVHETNTKYTTYKSWLKGTKPIQK